MFANPALGVVGTDNMSVLDLSQLLTLMPHVGRHTSQWSLFKPMLRGSVCEHGFSLCWSPTLHSRLAHHFHKSSHSRVSLLVYFNGMSVARCVYDPDLGPHGERVRSVHG